MFNLARSVLLTSPLLTVFGTALLVMMLDLFKPKSRFSTYFSYFGLLIGIILSIRLFPGDQDNIWINLFTLDNPGCILQIFILISVFLSIFFSSSKLSSLDSAQGDVLSLYLLLFSS